MNSSPSSPHVRIQNLEMRYGDFVVQRDLTFDIGRGEVFVIMGGSGCGKSTLLKHMIGLMRPAKGRIEIDGVEFPGDDAEARERTMRTFGVLYQQGALWSSLTLAENVMLPMEEYSALEADERREMASFKLALVGLRGMESAYPAEISGGMRKRAALARAMALDPDLLFLDEPSAGLDPISAKALDDLISQLNQALGTTVVMVTHELPSIFAIGTDSVFLDHETHTLLDTGNPSELKDRSPDSRVRLFLSRGRPHASSSADFSSSSHV